jgi:hypothetical protein
VDETPTGTKKCFRVDIQHGGSAPQSLDNTFLGAKRARGRLGQAYNSPAVIGDDKIGKRATNIDTDAVGRPHVFPFQKISTAR